MRKKFLQDNFWTPKKCQTLSNVKFWKTNFQELQDFDVDCVDEYGRTAIHVAARNGQLEPLKSLIELKSNINVKDKNGETALHLAAKHGQHRAVRILLQHDADHSLVSFVFVVFRIYLDFGKEF